MEATMPRKTRLTDKERRKAMLDAAWRHLTTEEESGKGLAIDWAISEMIGAAEYLTHRLGEERARRIIAGVHGGGIQGDWVTIPKL